MTAQLGFYHPGFPWKGEASLADDAAVAHGKIMLGSYFIGDNADGAGSFTKAADWVNAEPGRRVMVSGEPIADLNRSDADIKALLRRGALGAFDPWFKELAFNLRPPLDRCLYRPLRESYGAWYDWAAGVDPESFVKLFNRGYDIVKTARPNVEVVFCGASTGGRLRTKQSGTKYASSIDPPLCECDVIAVDNYRGAKDFAAGTAPELERLTNLGKANGKDVMVCEFGVYTDDPDYIQRMHDWGLLTPRVRAVVYQDGGMSKLSDHPRSRERMSKLQWSLTAA